jgi:hypothetical protein
MKNDTGKMILCAAWLGFIYGMIGEIFFGVAFIFGFVSMAFGFCVGWKMKGAA